MSTANIIGAVGGVLIIILVIFGLHKMSQLHKSVYLTTGKVTRGLMGESDSTIKKETANASSSYDLVIKIGPFIVAAVLLVIGILKLRKVPKDETNDEKEKRQLIGFAIIGGAGLMLVCGVINLYIRIY